LGVTLIDTNTSYFSLLVVDLSSDDVNRFKKYSNKRGSLPGDSTRRSVLPPRFSTQNEKRKKKTREKPEKEDRGINLWGGCGRRKGGGGQIFFFLFLFLTARFFYRRNNIKRRESPAAVETTTRHVQFQNKTKPALIA
jgi:hypothetical protein